MIDDRVRPGIFLTRKLWGKICARRLRRAKFLGDLAGLLGTITTLVLWLYLLTITCLVF